MMIRETKTKRTRTQAWPMGDEKRSKPASCAFAGPTAEERNEHAEILGD
jgi:hypothetical protein